MNLRRREEPNRNRAAPDAAAHEQGSRARAGQLEAAAEVAPIEMAAGDHHCTSPRCGNLSTVRVAAECEVEMTVADCLDSVGRVHEDDACPFRAIEREI